MLCVVTVTGAESRRSIASSPPAISLAACTWLGPMPSPIIRMMFLGPSDGGGGLTGFPASATPIEKRNIVSAVNQNLGVRIGFLLNSNVVWFAAISPQSHPTICSGSQEVFRAIASPGIWRLPLARIERNPVVAISTEILWLQWVGSIPREGSARVGFEIRPSAIDDRVSPTGNPVDFAAENPNPGGWAAW